jgi:hypothetical protein
LRSRQDSFKLFAVTFGKVDQCWAKRAAELRLRLMDLHEPLAVQAETHASGRLRALYAERYRRLIGVDPHVRQEFRHALTNLQGISVANLTTLFQPPYAPKSPAGDD